MVKQDRTSRVSEISGLYRDGQLDRKALDEDFIASLSNKELGELGEVCAMSFLESHGFTVIEHHYRCPEGEADLIAIDDDTHAVVLVEVKSRRVGSNAEEAWPELAVDERKRKRYRRIASCYMMDKYPVHRLSFDVIGISFKGGNRIGVTHYRDVFGWGAGE